MKKINLLFAALFFAAIAHSQTVADFENLTLPTDTFWDGSDLSGGFSSGNAYFTNAYDTTYKAWDGFTYSDMTDSVTPGLDNQYSAITASGYNGSSIYAVADEYGTTKIHLTGNATGKIVSGFYVTNNTTAYRSMLTGDAFAKKFGGVSGNDPDWFKLTVKGWFNGTLNSDSVDFYLADFRSSNNAQDYIVRTWQWVDLHTLGNVDSLTFHLSSDVGLYGMNTPAYFCVDNFTTADRADTVPVAVDDYVNITYDQDTLIDVLGNDTNAGGGPLTVQLVSAPLIPGASAVVDSMNRIWYIPAVGIVAEDTLTYAVCDAAHQCDTAQVIINVNGVTGINEIAAAQISLYPNPFNNTFTIYHPADTKEIRLYDLQGRIVRDIFCAMNQGTQISGDGLATGTYIVKLTSATGNSFARIVKQ